MWKLRSCKNLFRNQKMIQPITEVVVGHIKVKAGFMFDRSVVGHMLGASCSKTSQWEVKVMEWIKAPLASKLVFYTYVL